MQLERKNGGEEDLIKMEEICRRERERNREEQMSFQFAGRLGITVQFWFGGEFHHCGKRRERPVWRDLQIAAGDSRAPGGNRLESMAAESIKRMTLCTRL